MSITETSSNLLSGLSKWHQGRESGTRKSEVETSSGDTYGRLIDTFSSNLGKLQAQDDGPNDNDRTPGNVELVNQPKSEVFQLQKRGESGFRMVTLTSDQSGSDPSLKLTAYEMDLSGNTITCFEYDDACVNSVISPIREDMGQVHKTVLDLGTQRVASERDISEHQAGMEMEGDDIVWIMRDRLGKS